MVNELEYQVNNIVSRTESLHVFIGSFMYLVDFMVMENLGEFIDDKLTQIIFGEPFKRLTNLDEKLIDRLLPFLMEMNILFTKCHARTLGLRITQLRHAIESPLSSC